LASLLCSILTGRYMTKDADSTIGHSRASSLLSVYLSVSRLAVSS
jgi:hypothetical protein